MSRRKGDYEVGYGRPPKATQWKPGQSGNPNKRRPRSLPDALLILDRLLSEKIQIRDQGVLKTVTVLEAIVTKIWALEMAGDKRAAALRLRYEALIPIREQPRQILIRHVDEMGNVLGIEGRQDDPERTATPKDKARPVERDVDAATRTAEEGPRIV
jgi:Family of unknown function (DUF5681)